MFPRKKKKASAWTIAVVRLMSRCIVGQLAGCYGDLAGPVLGVRERLLYPLSLVRLVI